MSVFIKSARPAHPVTWLLTGLIGLILTLHTATLPGGIRLPTSIPRPVAALLTPREQMCVIPAHAMTPEVAVISQDIARRFHVARDAAASITRAAFAAARVRGIDPTLVLAVAAIESKFKMQAVNPVTGATGLMQVMPKWHHEKIIAKGGEPSLVLISPNINIGAAILADYLNAEDGDLEAALGRYLGTVGGVHYVEKVRREMTHLAGILEAG